MKLVVTGGVSGLGAALIERLARHEVWILDRQEPDTLLDGHHYVSVDLADQQSMDGAMQLLPAAIDGLANVAGMARSSEPEVVVAVNFLALRYLSAELTPRLKERGRIVNVSSIAGRDWQAKYERLLPLLGTRFLRRPGSAWCADNHRALVRAGSRTRSRSVLSPRSRCASAQDGRAKKGYTSQLREPRPDRDPAVSAVRVADGESEQSDWMMAQTEWRIASANGHRRR